MGVTGEVADGPFDFVVWAQMLRTSVDGHPVSGEYSLALLKVRSSKMTDYEPQFDGLVTEIIGQTALGF